MKSDFVGSRTDLISSAKQISSERGEDFIAPCAISLKSAAKRDIICSINKNSKGYSVMGDFIVAIALVMVSLFLFILGIRSFLEKGFLFNNAYIYASKKERETMNKKPYYRQTAIVFFLMGITFLLIGFAILFDAGWITYIAGVVIIIILIYAITSSIAIEKSKKQK